MSPGFRLFLVSQYSLTRLLSVVFIGPLSYKTAPMEVESEEP